MKFINYITIKLYIIIYILKYIYFSGFLFMITDIVFGVYHYNDLFVEMNRLRPFYFDWGYYVAIVAAILSFISAIMFGSLSFCVNRKTHEYEMET